MRVISDLPLAVREIENVFIPMTDGTRLAARLWLPEDEGPAPAVLEYIPYRKADGTRERDEPMHRYFAGHGFAAVRVDLRGTGESEGVLEDEYCPQEIDDALEVLAWIAAQPWCDGKVGMMGKSWGGFNALQVAAKQPPELAAILVVCASDDRYADDAHYMGGALLNENLIWGSGLFTLAALPPDPEVVGERWRAMWRRRLEAVPLHVARWMRHPTRDAYWEHGSVCEDPSAIRCPVFVVSGWADAYSNAVPRLLASLDVPRKGLVGPWAHLYPHEGVPGPAIGFLQEAVRWWSRWLRGEETPEDPLYRAWMQESVPPRSYYDARPGRWVAEDAWPSPRIEARALALGDGRLGDADDVILRTRSPQTTGLAGGSWCAFGMEGEMPRDQREDDGRSLSFTGPPLEAPLEILGAPTVTLRLSVDRPAALLAARLCDVSPLGASNLVTYGLLDLTHRGGHQAPAPLEPGQVIEVTLRLNDVAHAFQPGHRLRLALSTSYWPMAWPSPSPVTLALHTAGSALTLPVRPPRPEDAALRPFDPPEAAPGPDIDDLHPGGTVRTIERDAITGVVTHTVCTDLDEEGRPAMTRVGATGMEHGHGMVERFRILEGDPLRAEGEVTHEAIYRRGGWQTRVVTRTRLTADAEAFRVEAELSAYEGEARAFHRTWDERIPR
ncbi:MAG: CocE/NonD family hydrolase [Myxococcota bacterium]|nr:CocE/NonD family hydrolase [Myxococcota bacterium]